MRKTIQIGDHVICTESGVMGIVINIYTPTASEEQIMVKTDDSRIYHAPANLWRRSYLDPVKRHIDAVNSYLYPTSKSPYLHMFSSGEPYETLKNMYKKDSPEYLHIEKEAKETMSNLIKRINKQIDDMMNWSISDDIFANERVTINKKATPWRAEDFADIDLKKAWRDKIMNENPTCPVCGSKDTYWLASGNLTCRACEIIYKCISKETINEPDAIKQAKKIFAERYGKHDIVKEEPIEYQEMSDNVNHPSHYTGAGIECIDVLAAATWDLIGIEAVDTANAIKYLWRWKNKNGVEDLKKAKWYIEHLIAKLDEDNTK